MAGTGPTGRILELLEVRVMLAPPLGAGPLSCTVNKIRVELPPMTVVGLAEMPMTVGNGAADVVKLRIAPGIVP
jgi:hypothetical protein